MDENESKIAEFARLGIFFTNFSIRPSKMIKRYNFCKGFPSQIIKGWGIVFVVDGKNFKNLEKYLPLKTLLRLACLQNWKCLRNIAFYWHHKNYMDTSNG